MLGDVEDRAGSCRGRIGERVVDITGRVGSWLSPAKINLFLKVVAKRPDGYHELASLFQAIDQCDVLEVGEAREDRFTCDDPRLPMDGANLVVRAIELFRAKTGWRQALKVHLKKQIPWQAGLGGGSSNAATALWALKDLSGLEVTTDQLMAWGAELGSDIPFFFSEGTAYATGRGERVNHLPALPRQDLWIVKPAQGLSTPAVYKALRLDALPHRDASVALEACLSGEAAYFNDLEAAAFQLDPSLEALKRRLTANGYKAVVLCGSGSAFFCLGDREPPQLPDVRAFHCSFLRRQPGKWYAESSCASKGASCCGE